MNSWSRNNYESYKKEEKHENCRKEDRYEDRYEEKKCETFIKCGCPNSTTIPAGTANTVNTTLATFNLDTSCICDPKVKLDFTSNYVAAGAVSIRLQIFRQCKNQLTPVAIGSSWNLTVTGAITETFSFFICDQDGCIDRDCCTYTVVAIPNTATTVSVISFNNATLAATVTCGENSCHRRCDHYK